MLVSNKNRIFNIILNQNLKLYFDNLPLKFVKNLIGLRKKPAVNLQQDYFYFGNLQCPIT